jgi:hypothetical protein
MTATTTTTNLATLAFLVTNQGWTAATPADKRPIRLTGERAKKAKTR